MARHLSALIVAAAVAALLTGCSAPGAATPASDTATGSADAAGWPRSVEHELGTTEIPEKPLRIVSTSPSITGSLLAIDAPLIASGAATVTPLTDDQGFFTQWAETAEERGVEVAYKNLTLDVDAVDAFEPDLIIGSSNGGDATGDAYEQLSEIAPTVMLDYSSITWQELTTELGEITGMEAEAAERIAEYDDWVAEQAKQISLPEQPVTALVYMGADGSWAFTADSPQAELLTSLGFTYEPVAAEYRADDQSGRGVDVLTSENSAAGLAGAETILTVAMGGGDPVADFTGDPLLANQPAVANDRVFSLGTQSFRLDYYSAKLTVELLVDTFAG
ncbi:ABC transporter substrate-binding protein [Leucobacter sp. UCD-THU]|jgi:iron complex transport system substrate-binding protein|uniref:Fe2+-enterobactin ABC transporter substrate-binding protein n=1 Tax=Leucobacter muris TaxID=1935379 RepID=A0ABX5QHT9_9MICO|nr:MULTISPECIES: Fe2+-enterobactin ABC transporter substrate-binding protein [Leucobacter]EYT55485.1 ABC transporter substrate-binding protein [Leucobacter sp. UCD-THU]QAB18644.1 Fe2+-enterobactin ABC transporter substrate-binding protein [Leucobacter muris]